jgi:endonuclease VIII
VPEGDTLFRIAAGLRPFLVGRRVIAASARQPGPRTDALVGSTIDRVDSVGKHLLIEFDNGLELRTHLGLHGSWHRYAPNERWRRPASRARIAIEVPGAVAVCFDAPTVELYEARVEARHPVLASLGPDLLGSGFDGAAEATAVANLHASERPTVAEALLDQRALAGIGNVYKSEVLFIERVDPFAVPAGLDEATFHGLVTTARDLLLANVDQPRRVTTRPRHPRPGERPPAANLWVYGRAGRPCLRCGTPIRSRPQGQPPRLTYWCPACQPPQTD